MFTKLQIMIDKYSMLLSVNLDKIIGLFIERFIR
jgi:hypothetical protein